MEWSDGYKYVGEWKYGDINGQGTATWTDGAKWVGEWKDGIQDGQGILTKPDGEKIVGKWLNEVLLTKDTVETKTTFNQDYVFKYKFVKRNIFRINDPTTFIKLTFKKERNVRTKVPKGTGWKDGRYTIRWVPKNIKGFSYIAEYEDDRPIEIFVEYNKYKLDHYGKESEMKIAEMKARYYAKMMGQTPHFLRKHTNKLYLHRYTADYKNLPGGWAAPWKKEFHMVESNNHGCEHYYKERNSKCWHETSEIIIHELAHVVQSYTNVISPSKWVNAKKLDKKKYCSEYAMQNDNEDFAESVLCWLGVRYKSNRMNQKIVERVNEFLPNRIKFFDELNLNVHPYK